MKKLYVALCVGFLMSIAGNSFAAEKKESKLKWAYSEAKSWMLPVGGLLSLPWSLLIVCHRLNIVKIDNKKLGYHLLSFLYSLGSIVIGSKFLLDGAEKSVAVPGRLYKLLQKIKKEPEASLKDVVKETT